MSYDVVYCVKHSGKNISKAIYRVNCKTKDEAEMYKASVQASFKKQDMIFCYVEVARGSGLQAFLAKGEEQRALPPIAN
jgi:hypothetical protein